MTEKFVENVLKELGREKARITKTLNSIEKAIEAFIELYADVKHTPQMRGSEPFSNGECENEGFDELAKITKETQKKKEFGFKTVDTANIADKLKLTGKNI